jgi:hypothetical protein
VGFCVFGGLPSLDEKQNQPDNPEYSTGQNSNEYLNLEQDSDYLVKASFNVKH